MRREYLEQCPDFLREFLGYMETIKGRSSKTVDEYFTDLRTFFRYMKKARGLESFDAEDGTITIRDLDLDFVRSITLNDVYEFMNYVKNERLNCNKTRARKTTVLRVFFRHLTEYTHQLEHNPVENLDAPKAKKTLPKYLTLEQSIDLLKSVDGEFIERDYCMLTLLLNCGLRRAELAGINIHDISKDNTLRIRGKGGKERVVYLNDACQDAIKQYLAVRPVDGVKDRNALFLSSRKQRITLQGVHYVVKGYLRKIDGAEEYSTHKLRHTAATLMYQHGGVDIRVLKDILGHENLGTTEIYTHLSSEQIRMAAEESPLSNVKISHNSNRTNNKKPSDKKNN